MLRQIPTFSLFRRTSSLSSHPTAQGVSLRGIGPSGVSRTLVLLDGVPFNDPFGGWVYWTRVPLDSARPHRGRRQRGSSLYGNYAMGGVINIDHRAGRRGARSRCSSQYGNRESPKVDVSASDVWGKVGVVGRRQRVPTPTAIPIVAAAERGAVDNNAAVDFQNVNVKLEYDPTDRIQATVRAAATSTRIATTARPARSISTEEANDTTWTTVSGGVRFRLPDESTLQVQHVRRRRDLPQQLPRGAGGRRRRAASAG